MSFVEATQLIALLNLLHVSYVAKPGNYCLELTDVHSGLWRTPCCHSEQQPALWPSTRRLSRAPFEPNNPRLCKHLGRSCTFCSVQASSSTHGTSWGTWSNLPGSLPVFLRGEEPGYEANGYQYQGCHLLLITKFCCSLFLLGLKPVFTVLLSWTPTSQLLPPLNPYTLPQTSASSEPFRCHSVECAVLLGFL